jgi:hypothetical protein
VGEVISLVKRGGFQPDAAWTVRAAIRAARRRSGLSLAAFAAALAAPIEAVQAWENGDQIPPADRFVLALRLGDGSRCQGSGESQPGRQGPSRAPAGGRKRRPQCP